MKTSMEYARDAFKAVDNEKIYLFPGSCFSGEKRLSFHKMKKGYVLEFIDTEEQVDPILIESEDQLAEELRYLIPCLEDTLDKKEFIWDENIGDEDKEKIKKKIIEAIIECDGSEYDYSVNEFRDEVKLMGRKYSFSLYCNVAATGYWYFGQEIYVKRVR